MMPSPLSRRTLFFALTALAASAPAQSLFAGPDWDQTSGYGYRQPYLSMRPGTTAGLGYGIGTVQRATPDQWLGTRALRWDANGWTVLDSLGYAADGRSAGSAIGTNASGTIVGSSGKFDASGNDLGSRAVRWDVGRAAPVELGSLGTDAAGSAYSWANAINAGGTIVGSASKFAGNGQSNGHAVRWSAGSTAATELGDLGGTNADGGNTSEALGLNDAGTAYGWSQKFAPDHTNLGARAVRWAAGATAATALGDLGLDADGATFSQAYGIDAAGTIVGESSVYVGGEYRGSHAVRWNAGGTAATDLGALGTDANGFGSSTAVAINEAGMVAGWSTKVENGASVGARAVRWTTDGTIQELGLLDGATTAYGFGMNGSGIVVGTAYGPSFRSDGDDRAVMWGLDGVAVDLNALLPANSGWLLTSAVGISDSGLITGVGYYDPDGDGALGSYTRAYAIQLAPVPEPATFAALGLGAAGLLRRRRKA